MDIKVNLSKSGQLYCSGVDETHNGWAGLEVSDAVSTFIGSENYKITTSLVHGTIIDGLTTLNFSTVVYVPDTREKIEITLKAPDKDGKIDSFTMPVISPINVGYGEVSLEDKISIKDDRNIQYNSTLYNYPKWDMNDFIFKFGVNTYKLSDGGYFNSDNIEWILNIDSLDSSIIESFEPGRSVELPFNTTASITGRILVNGVPYIDTSRSITDGDLIQSYWELSNLSSILKDDYLYHNLYGTINGNRARQIIKVTDPNLSYYSKRNILGSRPVSVSLSGYSSDSLESVVTFEETYTIDGKPKIYGYNNQKSQPLGSVGKEKVSDANSLVLEDFSQNSILEVVIPVDCENIQLLGTPIISTYGSYSRTAELQYSLDGVNWQKYTSPKTLSLKRNDRVYLRQVVDTSDYGSTSFSSFISTTGNLSITGDYSVFNEAGVWICDDTGYRKLTTYCPDVIKISNYTEYTKHLVNYLLDPFNSEGLFYSNSLSYELSAFDKAGMWIKSNGDWINKDIKIYMSDDKFYSGIKDAPYLSDDNYIDATFTYGFSNYGPGLNVCTNNSLSLTSIYNGAYTYYFKAESEDKAFTIERNPAECNLMITQDNKFYAGLVVEYQKENCTLVDNKLKLSNIFKSFEKKIDFTDDIWNYDKNRVPPKSGYVRLYGGSTEIDILLDFYNVKKNGNNYDFYSIDRQRIGSVSINDTNLYTGFVMINSFVITSNNSMVSFFTNEKHAYFDKIWEED